MVNFIFLRKKDDFWDVFSAFYSQHSVTAAWATRSPWSIFLSFFLMYTAFHPLRGILGSWFSVCHPILTKLEGICKKKWPISFGVIRSPVYSIKLLMFLSNTQVKTPQALYKFSEDVLKCLSKQNCQTNWAKIMSELRHSTVVESFGCCLQLFWSLCSLLLFGWQILVQLSSFTVNRIYR